MPTNGLVVMTPTSIVSTGSGNSSSIETNGKVTYASCSTLSLNGVFTSSYDNYLILASHKSATFNDTNYIRLRTGGVDNSTASSYVSQTLNTFTTTTPAGNRATSNLGQIAHCSPTLQGGFVVYLFGPAMTQPTAWRADSMSGYTNALYFSVGGTHNQSISYDGFTIFGASISFNGSLTVFGFNK